MDKKTSLKVIQILTVSAIIFIVMLISALIINLIKLATVTTRAEELTAEIVRLNEVIAENQEAIGYKSSQEFIDRYAKELLDMKNKDETVYKSV